MMKAQDSDTKRDKSSARVKLVSTVTDPVLRLFIIMLLVVEGPLGLLAARSNGANQTIAISGMLFVLISVIGAVVWLTLARPDPQMASLDTKNREFMRLISGYWWSTRPGDELVAVIELSQDNSGVFIMEGHRYNQEGETATYWRSTDNCVNAGERTFFYYWTGYSGPPPPEGGFRPLNASIPTVKYEGTGKCTFNSSFNGGNGEFFTLYERDRVGRRYSQVYYRCAKSETKTLSLSHDTPARRELIQKKCLQLANSSGRND